MRIVCNIYALARLSSQRKLAKSTFFVANQANLEQIAPEKIKEIEAEQNAIDDENKLLAAEVKTASTGRSFQHFVIGSFE